MLKIILPFLVLLLIIASPVLAVKKQAGTGNETIGVEVEEECSSSGEWKNHGEYVSCVAKLKLGGAIVSEAAQSDIGKKPKTSPSTSPSSSPSATPSSSPSASPSANPSGSPSATPSASPSLSPEPSPTGIGATGLSLSANAVIGTKLELKALIEILQSLIKSLQHLIKF